MAKRSQIIQAIRSKMEQQGVTIYKIAQDSGVPYTTCYRLLNQIGRHQIDVVESLAKAVGLKLL